MEAKLKILVVDDNDAQAMTLSWVIKAWGYQVEVCTRGDDVLQCVDRFGPDVLLLDIAMPGKSGIDICRTLNASPTRADLTIIAQTGYGDTEHMKVFNDVGFDEVLLKPVDIGQLQSLLATLGKG